MEKFNKKKYESLEDKKAYLYKEVYTLHLALLNSEIQEHTLSGFKLLRGLVRSYSPCRNTVWLYANDSPNGDILVTSDYYKITNLFLKDSNSCIFEYRTHYIQEYESFEDAYKVALNMMEHHELCYNKEDEDNKE